MRQLRVYSNGEPGTLGASAITICDEDGNKIENISSATIWLDPAEPPRLDLTILHPILNVAATVDSITLGCHLCGGGEEHKCDD